MYCLIGLLRILSTGHINMYSQILPEYCKALFKRETVERFVSYFLAIINAVLEKDTITIKNISLPNDLEDISKTFEKNDFVSFNY